MPPHPTKQEVPVVRPRKEEPERKVSLHPIKQEVPLHPIEQEVTVV